ncbi:hypothetical protein HDU91_002220, partial [Kappamyces sp. JEL0680]
MYYILAHFSKFILPGSVRIDLQTPFGVETCAFETPLGHIVVVVHNRDIWAHSFTLGYGGASIKVSAEAHS